MPSRTVIMPVDGVVKTMRLLTTEKRWFDRLLYFQRLLARIEWIDGDIVECGVFGGESLGMLAALARSGRPRRVWGFDSWEGLPPAGNADRIAGSLANRLHFADTSLEDVRRTLAWYGFGEEAIGHDIMLVRGYFAETLPRYHAPIALGHIDADLYESYRDALAHLWPRLTPGGILAFDEYHDAEHWPGAKRAVDEFLEGAGSGQAELLRDVSYHRYYVIKLPKLVI